MRGSWNCVYDTWNMEWSQISSLFGLEVTFLSIFFLFFPKLTFNIRLLPLLFCSLLYPQHLEKSLVNSMLINTYWVNKFCLFFKVFLVTLWEDTQYKTIEKSLVHGKCINNAFSDRHIYIFCFFMHHNNGWFSKALIPVSIKTVGRCMSNFCNIFQTPYT